MDLTGPLTPLSGGGGGVTITSPGSTISVGGTSTAPTLDVAATGISAATYAGNAFTVNAQGQITGAFGGAIQWGVPVILPSGGSIGNNGALTLTVALPTTFSNGCYMFFPANAIASGVVAGVYYVVMSSTTVGTIFNNVLSGRPVAIASPTAFATTGPGAYTQTVAAQQTLVTIPIPAGSLGPNGQLVTDLVALRVSNTDACSMQGSLGGTQMWSLANVSNAWQGFRRTLRNMGVQNQQSGYNVSNSNTAIDNTLTTQTPAFFTLNTANALNYVISAQIATSASDYFILLGCSIQANYAP